MKKILVDVEGGVESFADEAQVDSVEVRDARYMHMAVNRMTTANSDS